VIIRFSVVLVALLFSVSIGLAQDAAPEPGPDQFDGQLAYQHVVNHVEVGPRPVATLGSMQAGNQILDYLESLGWEVSEDWHMLNLGSVLAMSEVGQQTIADWGPINVNALLGDHINSLGADSLEEWRPVSIDPLVIPVRNLVASMGSGPTIIIGAHYDSRIYSDKDEDPERRRDPMPGANDGGSGVGVLLELARVISEQYNVNREIRLVFFDAEDNGRIDPWPTVLPATGGYLIGSSLYAQQLNLANENIEYMLLVDLVGDMDQVFPIEGYSNEYAPEIVDQIWTAAAELGYQDYFPTEVRSPIIDDHVPFLQRGIPAVDIIDLDYPYWDTSEDTVDKVSPESLERIGRVLQAHLQASGVISRRN
jgi:hypothetical protein